MTEQTPGQNPLRAALDAVTDLAERVTKLTSEVVRLRTYGRHNRWFVVIDIILTIAIAASGYASVHASNTAHQNGVTIAQQHRSQVQGCRLNNARLARESSMWPYVESLLQPPPHATAKQMRQSQEIIAGIKAHARRAYAPRNCTAAYKLP